MQSKSTCQRLKVVKGYDYLQSKLMIYIKMLVKSSLLMNLVTGLIHGLFHEFCL